MSMPKVYRKVNPEWIIAWKAAHGYGVFDEKQHTPDVYINL